MTGSQMSLRKKIGIGFLAAFAGVAAPAHAQQAEAQQAKPQPQNAEQPQSTNPSAPTSTTASAFNSSNGNPGAAKVTNTAAREEGYTVGEAQRISREENRRVGISVILGEANMSNAAHVARTIEGAIARHGGRAQVLVEPTTRFSGAAINVFIDGQLYMDKGLRQNDFHLGNILLAAENIAKEFKDKTPRLSASNQPSFD